MDYVTALEIVTHVAGLCCHCQKTGFEMGPPAPYTRAEVQEAVDFLSAPRQLAKPEFGAEYAPQHAA